MATRFSYQQYSIVHQEIEWTKIVDNNKNTKNCF